MSEHIRFLEPHSHSAPLSIGNPANIRTNVILWKLHSYAFIFVADCVNVCVYLHSFFCGGLESRMCPSKTASAVVKNLRFKDEDKDKDEDFKIGPRGSSRTDFQVLVLVLVLELQVLVLVLGNSSPRKFSRYFRGLSRLSVSALCDGVSAGVAMT